MSSDRAGPMRAGRWHRVRAPVLWLLGLMLLLLVGLLVFQLARLRQRVEDVEARAGALEALAKHEREQISELQAAAGVGRNRTSPDTVALVIELGGEDFPQVIVRAGLDTERERRIVLLLPSQDRQRLDEMRREWPTLTEEEKDRYIGVLTAAVEEGVRREVPVLFVSRSDIQEALQSALDIDASATDPTTGHSEGP